MRGIFLFGKLLFEYFNLNTLFSWFQRQIIQIYRLVYSIQ